ncbi:DNA polymerase I, partial [hydrothermal vent metagenome]
KLVGISFSSAKGKAWYLPLAHEPGEGEKTIDFHTAIETVRPLLESARPKKCGHNIKYDLIVLENAGLKIGGVAFDTMIASYLINPSSKHALSAQVFARLGEKMIEYEEVCGKGVKAITFDKVPIEQAAIYSAEDADMTLRLYHLFVEEIKKEPQIKKLYYEIEIPTMQVLKVMEQNGVLIDVPALEKLSEELSGSIEKLEEKIYHLAGEKFNPASPKQVGVILFDKLGLPGGKKTKTGFSTSVDVLEQLSSLHELPADLLEFRSLSKLKNTYVDVLPKMIDKGSGRIHTSYNQAVAATGRLSSSDPNLQNIPIRTQTGRRIRQAFIAPAGYVLLAADYSQIELRLLAHFAKEEKLIEAFAEDRDIHKETASMLFDVVPELVTSDMRRIAKTVNFGVIYGQTPFGLARELNIPQNEAKRYIDNYFARYPGILDFNKQIIEQGKKDGYVQTLFGRRRYLPDLTSKNRQVRMFAERNAMNSPLQGTSADIIKIAMIKI